MPDPEVLPEADPSLLEKPKVLVDTVEQRGLGWSILSTLTPNGGLNV